MKNQNKHYQKLTIEERHHIHALVEIGNSITAIARKLGRHRSSISREIRRIVSIENIAPRWLRNLAIRDRFTLRNRLREKLSQI